MLHASVRRSALTALGLLAAALPVSVMSGASPVAAAGAAASDTVPVRIGSYNIQISRDMDQFTRAVNAFKPTVDVAGLQEIGGHVRNNWLDADTSWRIYRAPHLGQIPIIWDPAVFEFVAGREHKLAEGRQVEGGFKKTSYAAVARLRHVPTGQLISVVNVHLIQGAVNAGKPDRSKPRTWGYYVDQVANLKRAAKAETAAGFQPYVTGDFNIGYEADEQVRHRRHPYRKFKSIGMSSIWKGRRLNNKGTHIDTDCAEGRRYCGAYIDGIWSRATATSAQVLTHVQLSDHYPVVATFDFAVPPGYVPPTGTVGFAEASQQIFEENRPFQVREPLRFRLTGDMSHGFVDVEVNDGSAVEGEDFTVDTSSLYDNDLENNHVDIYRLPDFVPERDESFTLRLANPVNTEITRAESTGTILNDD